MSTTARFAMVLIKVSCSYGVFVGGAMGGVLFCVCVTKHTHTHEKTKCESRPTCAQTQKISSKGSNTHVGQDQKLPTRELLFCTKGWPPSTKHQGATTKHQAPSIMAPERVRASPERRHRLTQRFLLLTGSSPADGSSRSTSFGSPIKATALGDHMGETVGKTMGWG